MGKKELIFVYSTGRCGTAYLAQVFGKQKWSKNMIAYPQPDTVVMHEKSKITYRSFSVMKEIDQDSKTSLDIQRVYIQEFLDNQNEGIEKIFVTSNAIARFCNRFIISIHKNYKCIYIERNKEDFLNSTERRMKSFKDKYGQKNFNFYIRQRFNKNLGPLYACLHGNFHLCLKFF